MVLDAFGTGDPDLSYQAAVHLIEKYREQAIDLAKARYKLNFGTSLCDNCDGLRAGPGVTATCFQVKQCYFDNFREDPHPRHLRVLQTLMGDPEKS